MGDDGLGAGTKQPGGSGIWGCDGGTVTYGEGSRVGGGSLTYAGLGLGSGVSLNMGCILRRCALLRKTKRPEP